MLPVVLCDVCEEGWEAGHSGQHLFDVVVIREATAAASRLMSTVHGHRDTAG